MAGHRRSLSDSLLLDENVSGEKYFHEEDGTGGANIHFNKQKRNKGLDLLKLIENDKVQVLMKYGMKSSMSMDSLDQSVKSPNEMWKDSYEKLFNAKVKKFMTGNQAIQENKDGFHNRSLTGHSKRLASDLSNSHLMDFPAADCKSKVTVAAFLQNADRMRLTPYAAEPANRFGASVSYDAPSKFHSDLLLQGHDLMRVEKIKADTASDVDNEINLHGGMFKDPKIDLGISTPDSNLALPNTKGAPVINLTKGSFKGPKAEIIAHNIDMDVPSSKLKKTKLKLPKFNFPGFNKPDIDYNGSIKGSKLEVSSSELGAGLNDSTIQVDGTKADLKGQKTNLTLSDMDMPSGKLKMPTFNLPDFGLSRPKIKMLDNELKTPEMDLSSPKIDTDFNSPDFNIRGHKLDITAPDMNVDIPKGKIIGPNLKKSNLDINAPDLDINAPSGKLKLPKLGKLQASRSKENLDMTHSNMGMNPMRVSPQIVDNAGKYGRSPKIPKGYYTTDDICYNWKGMPRGDGRGNRQTEYGQTSSGHRQTIRGLQSHTMDLEVPESTLKVSRRFNPLTLIG
ncbi:neuroblast differentiation-associated protein AHNAK-like [Xyrauchen texanus]|uniref:neuroblast differentiation-associated protein AHNAK-like n=1 Tax=Xyrauchen texanus TaxID=154827 RepID=UPI00224193B5|nr:neuroblast differentiation-associated protein AHNAK-like [Xyrauchen texanus]